MTIQQVIEELQEIHSDATPKIQERLTKVITCLECDGECASLRASKARGMLEELGDNDSVESMTRMALFNVTNMLETI